MNSVGFAFQFYNLVPTLSAAENVVLIAELTDADAEGLTATVQPTLGPSPSSSPASSTPSATMPPEVGGVGRNLRAQGGLDVGVTRLVAVEIVWAWEGSSCRVLVCRF